ncbi:hypothetical protein ERN12_14925 [Rhodobacteraceae bacterium]|nr:hypothetical protein ERN12_14925 [Paracoccaceae bacterium]
MIAFFRFALPGLAGLTLIYVLIGVYARSLARERLEKAWEDPKTGAASCLTREEFIAQGMRAYKHSLRRKLLVLVYIVPVGVVAILVYVMNYR